MTQIRTKLAGNTWVDRAAYATVRTIVYVFCRTWCRMSIVGREHIPTSGAFLLAPTHRSILDTPIVSGVTRRRIRFMGADKYWRVAWFGRVLSALGAFPVTRGTADREALKRMVAVLEGGEPLVVFPEGERKTGPIVQPLFDGAVYTALKAQVPIIPVGIGGSERAMPKGSKFIYPRKVRVIVGAPIVGAPRESARVPRSEVDALSAQLHERLQELFDLASTGG